MCGINMVLHQGEGASKAIFKMNRSTAHRGPDHSAWLQLSDRLYVGGNRLITVDPGDYSNPPICTEDQAFCLVWNGAIYNTQELRNQLIDAGVMFSSRSDTEVLFQWLILFPLRIGEINGMYSFIFIDKKNNTALIARDPSGQKPLYYYQEGNTWVISSELRAIMGSGLAKVQLNQGQLQPYYYLRHAWSSQTMVAGIRQLNPGDMLSLDLDTGEASFARIAPVASSADSVAVEDMDFPALLSEAMLRHMEADVPVGLMLSGGVDSSLLLASWMAETQIPLHTYTASFGMEKAGYVDHKFAKKLAKKYRCEAHEVKISAEILVREWPEYISTLDQPVGDSAGFVSWQIAKAAKAHSKILISGAGADELFAGYRRHQAYKTYLKNPKLWSIIASFGKNFPFLPAALKKFFTSIETSSFHSFVNMTALQPVPQVLFNGFQKEFANQQEGFLKALAWDREVYLVQDILKVHDNALMAEGIEGRAPYLDVQIRQMAMKIPEHHLLSMPAKDPLVKALEAAGHPEIGKRKKWGFGLPFGAWMEQEASLRRLVNKEIHAFMDRHPKELPAEYIAFNQGRAGGVGSNALLLWNIFVLASWCNYHKL
ncbi:asparagine synthetase B [Echinicola pacifica]|uniref:asparagine synthase (glutamine-hydrolyzing) n=1 Tax=Echinicola pacifica TaxID=346377 RepID=A0A918PTP3_9BACT|nr:asparagine synthase (glutamine-hydrolyzing) [Echinicola pacifica]GGZ20875.1 asparagine synthetase B [Echinicola pacifica]